MVKTQKSEYGQMAKLWNGQKLKMWIEKNSQNTNMWKQSKQKKGKTMKMTKNGQNATIWKHLNS